MDVPLQNFCVISCHSHYYRPYAILLPSRSHTLPLKVIPSSSFCHPFVIPTPSLCHPFATPMPCHSVIPNPTFAIPLPLTGSSLCCVPLSLLCHCFVIPLSYLATNRGIAGAQSHHTVTNSFISCTFLGFDASIYQSNHSMEACTRWIQGKK